MTPNQKAAIRVLIQMLEETQPAAPLTFALMRVDPDHQPDGDLLDEMTRLGLAEYGKVKPDIRQIILND